MPNGSLVFVSPGVLTDAGGITISIVNGKVVIKRVPPWNPEILAEIQGAIAAFAHASKLKDQGMAQKFQAFAEGVLQARSKEIQEYIGAAGQAAAG
jgi:hypothetical protein